MHACKLHVQCLMGWWWWTLDGGRMSCVCDTSGNGFCENENCRYSWLKSIRLHYYSLVRPSPCYSTWTVHHCCSCCCFFFVSHFSVFLYRRRLLYFALSHFAVAFCLMDFYSLCFVAVFWCQKIFWFSFYSGLLIVVPNSKKPNCARSNATISIHLCGHTHTQTSLSHPS